MGKILIIDDKKDSCDWFRDELQDNIPNFEVVSCYSKEKAKSHLTSGKFDVVITDMRLPSSKEDGYELIKFIKTRFPKTQVIAYTAKPDLKVGLKCIRAGCNDYIDKVEFEELINVTKDAVEYSQSNADKDSLNERLIMEEWGELKIKKNSQEKGSTLENLCSSLFKTIPGWGNLITNVKSRTEEIDIIIKNESVDETWRKYGTIIQIECKYWASKKKPGKNEFISFYNKLNSRNKIDCRLGFFISINGFANTFSIELDKIYKEEIIIVPINKDHIWKLICANNRNDLLKEMVFKQLFK
ncbi:MAG: response regulator [Bacteroidales bacterium]|nr:response regulator [Bacteroidales bacterium]